MARYFRYMRSCAFALAALLAGSPGAAQTYPTEVSVITFPGSGRWPLWVAQDRGIDVQNRIRLKVLDTRDSKEQMAGLIDGNFDVAITAFDNVVAYREGMGPAGLPPAPVVAVMGLDAGLLSLVSRQEFRTVKDLRGQDLAVDALTTGYAFTLEDTLRRAGIGKGDYALTSIGGTNLRFEALLGGRTAATILMPPFTAMAEQKGLRRLVDVSAALGHYQGTVVAVRTDWAARNPQRVTRYIATHRAALAWLYDPANRAAAIAIYRKHLPNASAEAASTAYTTLIDPVRGFWRQGDLDPAGMRKVIDMRVSYGPAGQKLGPVGRYFDTTYLKAAKRLNATALPNQ